MERTEGKWLATGNRLVAPDDETSTGTELRKSLQEKYGRENTWPVYRSWDIYTGKVKLKGLKAPYWIRWFSWPDGNSDEQIAELEEDERIRITKACKTDPYPYLQEVVK